MQRYLLAFGFLLALASPDVRLAAQTENQTGEGQRPGSVSAADAPQKGSVPAPAGGGSGFRRFAKDVASDYRNFFSKETVVWYGAGLGAAGLVHLADDEIREALEDPPHPLAVAFKGGDKYGHAACQIPLAVGWWVAGRAAGSERGAQVGRDLLRAQINAGTWTAALKFAVRRTRPNGDPRSFPSGHTSATFATAMVLQQHYGWKLGLPFSLGATYTAVSRISSNKHWASDVVFGAAVGMASARTVTLHLRKHKITLMPVVGPGGGGITLVYLE